jgi:hypothetical protein
MGDIKTKITTRKDGYQVFTLNGKLTYVHRYLAQKHIPNPENKCCVNHIDGNPSNNSLNNLEWVTYLENTKHAIDKKLWGKNILDKRKLTKEQLVEIKNKYIPKKYTIKKIAMEYNVDYKTIWNVINKKSYVKEL